MLGGPSRVTVMREDRADAIVLRATHDGYAERYGILHERTISLSADGTRLEGEDVFRPADGGEQVQTSRDKYAMRFHLHPAVKATRLADGHGAMLMAPDKDVWTFSVRDGRVELEDSVYLAGAEGPRRTDADRRLRSRAPRAARGLEPAGRRRHYGEEPGAQRTRGGAEAAVVARHSGARALAREPGIQ